MTTNEADGENTCGGCALARDEDAEPTFSRRHFLAGIGGAGAIVATVGPFVVDDGAQAGASTTVTIKTSAVPVGSAYAFKHPSSNIPGYVVQPTKGSFLAFSRVCTHQGCTIGFNASEERFICPCHGSEFNAKTGAVIQGPAQKALNRFTLTVKNGQISIA